MKVEVWAIGAESSIFRVELWNRVLALKKRPEKPYLLDEIDRQLRRSRTSRECRMLTYARSLGVPTPSVYSIDMQKCAFLMDFIDGQQMKHFAEICENAELEEYCQEFGRLLALMHKGDVVHGDPTTSNVIIDQRGRLWLVDFGLSEWNADLEMKGVDLHLVRRALETTHWDKNSIMFASVWEGYQHLMGPEAFNIEARMEEIRERGRYH